MNNIYKKPELLLPAGSIDCLRSAVNNGADAVYLGLLKFNARQFAENFNEKNIASIVKYCHNRNVKVYITFNTLIKNSEIEDFFQSMAIANNSGADAVIIQDPCFIQIIKKNFPNLKIHLSTQATILNLLSIPDGVDRVILARELSIEEIKLISQKFSTEIFVHGALCFSYSGQCLFSSIVGGRSGNRGMCAQPCRKIYNNKYLLSTMDLCMLEKIPELINAGVSAFKVEGRMKTPLYVATVAKIYRKYIDNYFLGKFSVDENDIDELKLAFNREFTTGFAFNDSIVSSSKPMNRGLYLGRFVGGKLELKKNLSVGDGIGIWISESVDGYTVKEMKVNGVLVKQAKVGEFVEIETMGAKDRDSVYKTSSGKASVFLGDGVKLENIPIPKIDFILPKLDSSINCNEAPGEFKIFAKVYNQKSALACDSAKADIIYYDVLKQDCLEVKQNMKNSKFFVFTPRIISDSGIKEIARRIKEIQPEGVLVGNRGLLKLFSAMNHGYEIHLDYSFNIFNDIDLDYYKPYFPIISPELNFQEISSLVNKKFIVIVHGDIVLMTTKERLKAPELIDEEGRHFRVRQGFDVFEILNSKQVGLFNKAGEFLRHGIKYFYIDVERDVDKYIRVYRKILSGEFFDDTKIRKGCTTGHFGRGVE